MQLVNTSSRIVVKLGDDFNWRLHQLNSDLDTPPDQHGVLDPRQVRHLLDDLAEYRKFGIDPSVFTEAFRCYAVVAEVSEGILQLEAVDANADGDLFALPVIDEDGDGRYWDFLDALSAARVRKLNVTHHYVTPCTIEEVQEELETLDHDRYISDDAMHAFDQITEILNWSPAEWDQP